MIISDSNQIRAVTYCAANLTALGDVKVFLMEMKSAKQRAALVRLPVLALGSLLATTALTHAQTLDLGAVGVSGTGVSDTAVGTQAKPGTAAAVAPTQGNLHEVQPQTIVSDKFIQDEVAPSSDYTGAVKLVPSLVTTTANGPGGAEAKITLRGFQDGEYNITMDGVPFGDTNDFTHHSTAYFPAGMLGQVVVDRGPGYASTIGNATFGGTVALQSREFKDQRGADVTASIGSWNTQHYGAELQSGKMGTSGTQVLFDYNDTTTDGYLQNASSYTQNYTLKVRQPIADRFVLTAFSSLNKSMYHNISKITSAQATQYGSNYAGLNNDPTSQQNADYNITHKTTDMEYVDLKGDLSFLQFDNNAYTYSYINKDHETSNQNGTSSIADNKAVTFNGYNILTNGDVPVFEKENRYRAYGDTLTLSKDIDAGLASGTLRTGIWYEHQDNNRYYVQEDGNKNFSVVTTGTAAAFSGYQYNLNSYVDNLQPFVEYNWKPTNSVTITPGYKHIDFQREQQGSPNQLASGAAKKSAQPSVDFTESYDADLAFITGNYRITDALSAYGEIAQGFLAPNVNVLYVSNPGKNSVAPETTLNYQTGLVYKDDKFAGDVDLYYIDMSNTAQQFLKGTPQAYYANVGEVIYKGVEAEGTRVIGEGFSAFAGGSLNRAKTTNNGLWIANAPDTTLNTGLLYDQNGLYGSLINHYVGHQYASTQVSTSDANRMKPYNSTDLVVGYRLGQMLPITRDIKVEAGVSNLFDRHSVTDSSGTLNSAGTALTSANTVYWQTPRSFFTTITASF